MQGHIKGNFFHSSSISAVQTHDAAWLLLFCIHGVYCPLIKTSLKPQGLPPWWWWRLGKRATGLLGGSVGQSSICSL